MKIEKELLHFKFGFQPQSLKLSQLQTQYLSVLNSQSSIESTVDFFLKQGWLVSFIELFALIEKLVQAGALINPNFQIYFQSTKPQIAKAFAGNPSPSKNPRPLNELKALPFFRSLEDPLAEFLLQQAQVLSLPARTYVCKAGDSTRDMYVLLRGQAGVYRPTGAGQHQLVASLTEGSPFGEAGFFLGTPRSANIVTLQESEVLRIPYRAEVLDRHIDKSKAQSLQLRFWIQHALQNSDFFKNIPSDCLDSLGFAGKVVKVSANQILFREGDAGHTAYVVIQGSLVASQAGQNIHVLNQGAFFGEISLLVSQGQRTASIHSQQESLLLEIHQHEFYRLLSQNLFLAKELEELAHQRLQNDQKRLAK